MKIFCVIQDDGKSYLVKAVQVFEVSSGFQFVLSGHALAEAIQNRRPHSYLVGSRWHTRFEDFLPKHLRSGIVLKKVRSI